MSESTPTYFKIQHQFSWKNKFPAWVDFSQRGGTIWFEQREAALVLAMEHSKLVGTRVVNEVGAIVRTYPKGAPK